VGVHRLSLQSGLQEFRIPLVNAATAATVLTGIRFDAADSRHSVDGSGQSSSPPTVAASNSSSIGGSEGVFDEEHFSAALAQQTISALQRQIAVIGEAARHSAQQVQQLAEKVSVRRDGLVESTTQCECPALFMNRCAARCNSLCAPPPHTPSVCLFDCHAAAARLLLRNSARSWSAKPSSFLTWSSDA
jgi:hypothetical protein